MVSRLVHSLERVTGLCRRPYNTGEGLPVVGHSLGECEESGGEVFGVMEGDAQFAGAERDAGGQVREAPWSRSRGNPHAAASEQAAGAVDLVGEAGAACGFPLEAVARGGAFQAGQHGLALDREGVAGLEAGEAGHELAGAAFPDAEELLDGAAVEMGDPESAEFLQNFLKPMEPGGLGGHAEPPPYSLC
jgi:hypothetical protein